MDLNYNERDEYAHEDAVQEALVAAFAGDDTDLAEVWEEAGLRDATGQPVTVRSVTTFRDAGVLTMNRGVVLDLSDGSQFQLTVVISRRPEA